MKKRILKKWEKGILRYLWCFSLAAFFNTGITQTELISIVAIVDDEIITSYDLSQRGKQLVIENRGKGSENTYQKQALEELIAEALWRKDALKVGHSVSRSDIREHLAFIAKVQNTTPEKLVAFYKSQGVNIMSLNRQLENQLLKKAHALKLFGKKAEWLIRPNHIKSELQNYEQAQLMEFQLQQIAFTGESDKMKIAQGFRLKILQKMENGAKFADIGASISNESQGIFYRDLSWQPEAIFQNNRKLIDLMISLKTDSITPAIEFGNRKDAILFYLQGKKIKTLPGVSPLKFDVATLSIHSLDQEITDEQIAILVETLETIQSKNDVCNEKAPLSNEVKRRFQRNLAIDGMTIQNRNTILAMNVGQYSKVSLVDKRNSGNGIIAWTLVLCRRTGGIQGDEGKEIAMKAVRQKLLNANLDSLIKEHLKNLRQRAYIEIR